MNGELRMRNSELGIAQCGVEVCRFTSGHAHDKKDDRAEHRQDNDQHHKHRVTSGNRAEVLLTRSHTDGTSGDIKKRGHGCERVMD